MQEFLNYLKGAEDSHRNYMIAKMQLNTSRRISDIVPMKVSDIFKENESYREYVTFTEKKTGKIAKIALNDQLKQDVKEYIVKNGLTYDDYLFQSRKGHNKPLTTTHVSRIFQDAAQALNIDDFGTHSLRKTWGYFVYNETRNIALLMDAFNHASEKETLRYIGITQTEKDVLFLSTKF